MKEKLELVKFNLTTGMTEELIRYNNLKKQLFKLKQNKVLDKQKLNIIKEIEIELKKTRISFIKQFRENNKEEINKYLQIKDQY